mmetsp:Transcript_107647/g.335672  ORF Transcript_107647/g.335672 Transcript_107647/m.335672 type:complete len:112 (+) Transcript_107647:624-959(+)
MLFDNAFSTGCEPYRRQKAAVSEGHELEREINDMVKIMGDKLYVKHTDVRQAFLSLRDERGVVTRETLDEFFRKMCVPTEASRKVLKALCAEDARAVDCDKFVAMFGPVLK